MLGTEHAKTSILLVVASPIGIGDGTIRRIVLTKDHYYKMNTLHS